MSDVDFYETGKEWISLHAIYCPCERCIVVRERHRLAEENKRKTAGKELGN